MIINNSQLIELFGTNANKEQYAKTRKVNNTAYVIIYIIVKIIDFIV